MSNRMLEAAISTSPTSSMKPGCNSCEKRHLCHRLVDNLEAIARLQVNVWDLEYKIRIKSIHSELNRLGFAFPDSIRFCEINRMTHKEVVELLREAQELLIEMKNHNDNDSIIDRKSV